MLRSEQKKLEELGIFRCFSALLDVNWPDPILQPDPPDPDIVVHLDDELLGIEITGIYDESENLQVKEGEQRELLAKARALYERAGHPSLTVSVNWNDKVELKKRDRPLLAEKINALITRNLPVGSSPVDVDLRYQSELPLLSLRMHRTPGHHPGHWGASRASFPRPCDPADVQGAIDRKAGKATGYKARCSRVWVIVTANHADPSTWCTDPDSVGNHKFSGPFDRAYFMQVPGKLIALELTKS